LILAATNPIQIFPNTGFFDQLFHQTFITVNILGLISHGGYTITLAGLIVILLIALLAGAISERLAGEKIGKSIAPAVLITLLGAYIFTAYVNLPTEIIIENVHIIAALLGAVVFGVFWVLLRRSRAPKKAAA
jgi:drug/metabolite transporter (DMT)-like permease